MVKLLHLWLEAGHWRMRSITDTSAAPAPCMLRPLCPHIQRRPCQQDSTPLFAGAATAVGGCHDRSSCSLEAGLLRGPQPLPGALRLTRFALCTRHAALCCPPPSRAGAGTVPAAPLRRTATPACLLGPAGPRLCPQWSHSPRACLVTPACLLGPAGPRLCSHWSHSPCSCLARTGGAGARTC